MTNAVVEMVNNLTQRGDKFAEYNKSAPSALDFEQECLYARQAIMANDFLCGVAAKDQQSLVDAIYNVASTGISLNSARKHAYLVPRKISGKHKVCLDISYRGLLKLATDTGVTKYMKAELVYENDNYHYVGFDQRPTLECNPFKDRGALIGVYALAVLHDNSILVENMTIDQINGIRDDSEAYKGAQKYRDPGNQKHYIYKNCVWVKYYEEMVKKTVLKRAFKTLPETKGKEILDFAVDKLNEHEGIEFDQPKEIEIAYTLEESNAYEEALDKSDFTGLISLVETLSSEAQPQLWKLHHTPRTEKGGIGRYDKMMGENFKVARELREDNLLALVQLIDEGDQEGVNQIFDECNQYEQDWYMRKLDSEKQSFINQVKVA